MHSLFTGDYASSNYTDRSTANAASVKCTLCNRLGQKRAAFWVNRKNFYSRFGLQNGQKDSKEEKHVSNDEEFTDGQTLKRNKRSRKR